MMTNVRRPAVAGLFYPDDPWELRAVLQEYLGEDENGPVEPEAEPDLAAEPETTPARAPVKAIIAPHAGYRYSAVIAACAYRSIAGRAAEISRVVLLGPAHRLPFSGIAYANARAFATPLGDIPVDHDALAQIAHMPGVVRLDKAFDGEHCLEVQLPFLQVLLQEFRIVPLLVGGAADAEVAAVLERLWGGDETLIVISSDLSHYLDYATACRVDAQTSDAIRALRPEAISTEQACGRNPIAGLLRQARRHRLHAELLELRNSGDTAGPREHVVGYGAYAFR
jgi:AmmeMemoRadiSam system protein B